MGRAAAACALALAVMAPPAHGAHRAKPDAPPPPDPVVVGASLPLPLAHAPMDAQRLALTRAAFAHARGDLAGVVHALEPLALEARSGTAPPFPDADRAAFLLGHAWLRLGQGDRFAALARATARWTPPTAFTRWLAFELRLSGSADAPAAADAARTGQTAADALAASQLLRDGNPEAVLRLLPAGATREPLLVQLRAAALAKLGRDDGPELELLAGGDTTSALGRDLAGAALVRLATRAAEKGGDPRALLARVASGSRYAANARHMGALATLERGDAASGRSQLEALLAEDSVYAGRREAEQALAGQALDQGRWDDALVDYAHADSEWVHERDQLRQLLAPDSAAGLWQAWEHDRSTAEALVLDGMPAEALTERLALDAADLGAQPAAGEPELGLPSVLGVPGPHVTPPPAEDWDRVAASARALASARGALVLATDSLARERTALADQRHYFGYGLGEVRDEGAVLARHLGLLDSLRARMDNTAQRLIALRDAATLRFQRRAAGVLARLEAQERWIRAMKHFYLDGPDGRHQAETPPTWKGPDVVLQQEAELAQSLRFSAGHLLADSPRRIAAAYEQQWGPHLIDRATALGVGTREALAWSRALDHSLDSTLATVRTSAEEARLAARAEALARGTGQLADADARLRAGIARGAVTHALDALQNEREGIDYGLAAAAYARSVKLSAADTLPVAASVRAAEPGAPAALDASADSASRRNRDEAISRASIFLADHPDSPARGEMRFRLADLLITAARADFRDRMTAWVAAQAAGHAGPVPVVDHAQALTLYRHILDEDADFPHRDAVLFNAGMLLADAADPAAGGFFTRLIREFPASSYVQEASLRLGDLAVDQQQLGDGVTNYQRAASGSDPSLRAIALYKSGWAHYNADRFEEAAQAFRGVLDLYASDARLSIQADIEQEAEQYFVFSLAAAGGADAYERQFPAGDSSRSRERPYARRVLRAMGQHFRRYGEFGRAVAVDELYLKRWPADAAALEVAGRLAETQAKAERPGEERATRLRWAEDFAPGGAWANAQTSDSLRNAGAEFARDAWRAVAFEHHKRARETGSSEEWRAALRNYQTLLARWPADSASAVFELHAGEACAELGDYPAALEHYRVAAAHGRDSVATRAAWQQVAVTDRWYESSRPAAVRGIARGPGSDSLARAVITAADSLLQREPGNPKAADLVWRECQLTLAHGWNDQALLELARFSHAFANDPRAPLAANERAEVYFRAKDFAAASDAFDEALTIARRAGADTLARRAEKALPVCAYARAEASVAADSTQFERHAQLFEDVAKRWPGYEYAPVAQYRAGLAWLAAGHTKDGVRALGLVAEHWPKHALAREAHLKSAQALEAAGDREHAATAWLEFSQKHPDDPDADKAWLKAADLCDSAGQGTRADDLRAQYLKRWPADQESAIEILETLAHKELASLGPDKPLATLLPPPPPTPRRGAKRAPPVPAAGPPSYLAQYMKRIAQKPALASKPLLAEVRFRYAEEAFQRCADVRLTQPLPKSIAAKQKQLDSVLVRYRRTVDMGVPEWAHAATYRIGEALVGFGEALEKSERPADLKGDDLKAYENVLTEQSVTFHDRGESVWTDLLERTSGSVADAWITRARGSLWARLGDRFLFEPERDFPVVEGTGPGHGRAPKAPRDSTLTSDRAGASRVTPVAGGGHE
jgi:TolA-binding protein